MHVMHVTLRKSQCQLPRLSPFGLPEAEVVQVLQRYIIHPETCLGGACVACNICSGKGIAYMPFYFHDPETGDVIGEYDNPYTPQVRKVWAGWKKECCSTADTFTVVFPKDATVKRKAGLLGMTFLIDFTIFEGHQQSATHLATE